MKKVITFGLMLLPSIAFAAPQLQGGVTSASNLVVFLKDLLNVATGLIFAAAVVFFLWNVFKFVMSAGDEEKRKEGLNGIVYGIIGIAVMASVWGLVGFLTGTAGFTGGTSIAPPSLSI
ncbi:MAG: pilin [bacterium]|nr:pilin [bacterium]